MFGGSILGGSEGLQHLAKFVARTQPKWSYETPLGSQKLLAYQVAGGVYVDKRLPMVGVRNSRTDRHIAGLVDRCVSSPIRICALRHIAQLVGFIVVAILEHS